MAYKLMVIDDDRLTREKTYEEVLTVPDFDPLYIWNNRDFLQHYDTPVDGYIIDVFLEEGDWKQTNIIEILKKFIQNAPRLAPVFLVSRLWGDERVLGILKQTGESSVKVVQYLAWSEFEEAAGEKGVAAEKKEAIKARMDALRNKLLFELDHWHGRSRLRSLADHDTIRLLLLADVQFGDPTTDPKATFAENWIAHTLKKDGKLPDLILVAGDVSHSGRPDQFAFAKERLVLDLIGPLWGEHNIDRFRDRILLVPGNHDVNLRFSACDGRIFDPVNADFKKDNHSLLKVKEQPYLFHHDYALEPFRRFAHQLTGDKNWENSRDMSWVDRRFIHYGIRFFFLNSVSELKASMPDHASFSEAAVKNIMRSIGNDDPESIFSIAVSHHGLRPPNDKDNTKELDNWSDVGCDLFSMYKIRLWLYGHYHKFDARSLNCKPFEKTPLWLLQVPTSRISCSTRGFCILELSRVAGKINDANVHYYVLENNTSVFRETRRVFDKG